MEEEFTPQPKLSREEVLAEYVKTGLDMKFADRFQEKYLEEYDAWSDYDNASDSAMKCLKNGFKWYVQYHQNGHDETWCEGAYRFGCDWIEYDFSLENEIACMEWICEELSYESLDFFNETKETEFAKHFSFVEKEFSRGKTFMRFYAEYVDDNGFNQDMLSIVSNETAYYEEAIRRGKSEDFAYFYATWGRSGAWRIAELRDRLQAEGKDDDYIRTYLYMYADGLEEDGAERKHPDVPALWEEKVDAGMKAWDYARKEDSGIALKDRPLFVKIYIDVYIQASRPENPKAIPWDRFDDFVMDIALRRYKGENAEIEPRTLEGLLYAIERYK